MTEGEQPELRDTWPCKCGQVLHQMEGQIAPVYCPWCGNKYPVKVIILDNNPVSIAGYLEEFGHKYDFGFGDGEEVDQP